jgi:basic membrane protein A
VKKAGCLILAMLLWALTLTACLGLPAAPSLPALSDALAGEAVNGGAEVALLTTPGRLEETFGQEVRAVLTRFAGENGLAFASYKTEENPGAAGSTLELAIKGGARLVVAMDATVSEAVTDNASLYPEVDFILMDGAYGRAAGGNTARLQFSAAQAGWLAGYVAMREQRGVLGLVSLPEDISQQYALGFMLGADTAAREIGLEPMEGCLLWAGPAEEAAGEETTGEETAGEAWFKMADTLYAQGAGIVFCTFSAAQAEVLRAARADRGWMMGLELQPDTASFGVLAAVWHDPKPLLTRVLANWNEGRFPAGSQVTGGVAEGSVLLEYRPESFEQVGAGMLNRIPALFSDGELAAQLERLVKKSDDGAWPAPEQLGLSYIRVQPPEPAPPPDSSAAPASAPPDAEV